MTDLEQVRTIVTGYKAAHLLEQERLNELAEVIYGTYAKRDLRAMSDKEAKIAAEFGTVADLLDQAAAVRPRMRIPEEWTVLYTYDAGAYVDELEAEA